MSEKSCLNLKFTLLPDSVQWYSSCIVCSLLPAGPYLIKVWEEKAERMSRRTLMCILLFYYYILYLMACMEWPCPTKVTPSCNELHATRVQIPYLNFELCQPIDRVA